MRETGFYQRVGDVRYFIPHPLPPANPPFDLSPELVTLAGDANFELGRLNEIAARLPDPSRFVRAYVIKEALLSSAIEGIHTTLLDVFTQPLLEVPPTKATQLVMNYTVSLESALKLIQDDGLPLVSRVILRAHEALMSLGEGDKSMPGKFRKQSVRVGELVPPPAPEVPGLMGDLENFINDDGGLPPLIKAGLAHVQFETIHPFLDGNGRIGRLLIVLMLIKSGLLKTPILYPSYYFKKHRAEYYYLLDRVRTQGDFEGWIAYYVRAIKESARDASLRAHKIERLGQELGAQIDSDKRFARTCETARAALSFLFRMPVVGANDLSQGIGKSYNTAQSMIQLFVELGILVDEGKRKRNRLYRFAPYLALLEKEFEAET